NFHGACAPTRSRQSRQRRTMRSGSFVHLGFLTAAALAVSFAAAAPAYHGSARGGGIVTARNEAARNFTAAARRGRGRPSTYHVTDKTRFVVGGAPGSWRGGSIRTGLPLP